MSDVGGKVLRPKAGTAFIKLDPLFKNLEGGIVVSDGYIGNKLLRRKTSVGVVSAMTPYPNHKYRMAVVDKRGIDVLKCVDAWKYNHIYADLVGKQVIIESGVGQEIDDDTFVIRLEHILMIVPNHIECKPAEGDMPRCPRCKSAGVPNIIMTTRKGKYVCPMCNMTAEGDRVEDLELGSSAELDDLQNPEKRTKKGTIFSYNGQTVR